MVENGNYLRAKLSRSLIKHKNSLIIVIFIEIFGKLREYADYN